MLRSQKGQRSKLHNRINQELAGARQLVDGGVPDRGTSEEVRAQAGAFLSVLDTFQKRFDVMSDKISELSEGRDDEEAEQDAEFVIQVTSDIARVSAQLSALVSRIDRRTSAHQVPAEPSAALASIQQQIDKLVEFQGLQLGSPDLSSSVLSEPSSHRGGHSVRLPKLELDKFSGDVLRFQEFWDSFDAAIHSNPCLQPVEKLNYLRSYLSGEAKNVISGVSTSEANYEVAVNLIQKRFGNPQTSIDAHYSRLASLSTVPNQTSRIRSLFDEIEKHLRCLSALGEDTEHRHFISLIMSKLPKEVIVRLEESKDECDSWSVQSLRNKLQGQLHAREAAERQHTNKEYSQSSYGANQSFSHSRNPKPLFSLQPARPATTESLVAGEKFVAQRRVAKCLLCGGSHFKDQCQKFRSVDERRRKLRGRCFICLKPDHQAPQCQISKPCFHCKESMKHNRCLCPIKFSRSAEVTAVSADDSTGDWSPSCPKTRDASSASPQVAVLATGGRVLLQPATVEVKGPRSSVRSSTRVLLDCASNRSYISVKLAQKLQIKPEQSETFSVVTFGSDKPKTVDTSVAQIEVFLKSGSSRVLDVNIVPKITGTIHRSRVQLPETSFLWKDLPLADSFPTHSEDSPVDFLIGNDYYLDIVTAEKMEVGNGLYLLGSQFGWLLTGRIEGVKRTDPDLTLFVSSFVNRCIPEVSVLSQVDPCLPIKPSFDDFWKLESIGIMDNPDLKDDDKAISQFNSTVQFCEGRYQVSWPWKDSAPDLPENYQLSFGRFKSLLKKFQSDSHLFSKYASVIQDQEEKGVIERVTNTCQVGPLKHYIPHHAVCTPTKTTTKVRIVYDASSKVRKSVKSLNECLLRGLVILSDLCGLLLRFRVSPVAIVSDIEKAFLQIGLQPADRDVTRFFWLKDPTSPSICNDNLQVYRFCRVPFGIISSPFLLGATVKYHLMQSSSPVAKKITDNLYVDNVVTGLDSIQEAIDFYRQAKLILATASMNLREWASSSPEVRNHLPEEDKINEKLVKVLGLTWNTETDVLRINVHSADKLLSASTKRQVFQSLASVFDPLGFFAPLTVRAKIFIHQLWSKNLDWDDTVDQQYLEEWKEIAAELLKISNCDIPRFIGSPGHPFSSIQLFCFCDASAQAYATVIYVKSSSPSGCQVRLIFAKSRLAPSKKITIPRLELLAVTIGVRCLKFVGEQIGLPVSERILWTDSQCVLHWLSSKKPLTVFVENRLKEIKKHRDISFKYVSTLDNPADIATRGVFTYDDVTSSVWWDGPSWLRADSQQWPSWPYDLSSDSSFPEETHPQDPAEAGMVVSQKAHLTSPYDICSERFSSLIRLLRVTAWVTRFICKVKRNANSSGPLQSSEILAAKQLWDGYVQTSSFPEVFRAIRTGNKCNLKEQLNLKKDVNGILRCYGRFFNADLPEDAKFPKLLPRTSHYTDLVIRHYHTKLLHSGVNHTLSQLRLEYWIPQGRLVVRSFISKCVTCRRLDGGPYKVPMMPPWPVSRITKSSPFSYTGLDYLGPLYVKNGPHQPHKVWVCLFTCLAVRAIHLELIDDLSASQFLLCFRRFIARRGKPIQILSDNATQFKLSKDVINRLWGGILADPDTVNYISSEGIAWKFIIERAPWMGGFYERLVGSVKRALKKSIGRLSLTSTQLSTVLTEVEAVINSRPLFYIGDDHHNCSTVSPGDFLSLNPKPGIPVLDSDNFKDPSYNPQRNSGQSLLESWKKGHKLLNQLWKTWNTDYLASLRERSNYLHIQGKVVSSLVPAVGDVVMVGEDNQPRGSWRVGRICSLVRSQDGFVRAAQVKIPSGNIVNRPLKVLYPLECSNYSTTTPQPRRDSSGHINEQASAQMLSKDSAKDIKERSTAQSPDKSASTSDTEDNTRNSAQAKFKRRAATNAQSKIHGWIQDLQSTQ